MGTTKHLGRHLLRLLAGLSLVVGLVLVLAPAAQAQDDLPPICEDYPDLDVCNPEPQPPEPPDDGDDGDGDVGPAGAGGGGDGDGSLPFTGYPMTDLLLLLLALLVAGLTIRALIAARERLQARSAP